MPKRAKVKVLWHSGGYWWVITPADSAYFSTKVKAVANGASRARGLAPSELYVFNRKGRISERRTYKGDPEASKG